MNAIVIDDNPMHQLELEVLLDQNSLDVIGKFDNCEDADEFISSNNVDLIILDLFIQNVNEGIQFAKKIYDKKIPYIVCTSFPYKELPQELIKLKANGILVKPINEHLFSFEIEKIKAKNVDAELKENYIVIKEKKSFLKLSYNEISHLIVEGNYSVIFTKDRRYVLKKSLRKISSDLPANTFVQINRSTIVNINSIKQANLIRNKISLNIGTDFPVGQKFLKPLKVIL